MFETGSTLVKVVAIKSISVYFSLMRWTYFTLFPLTFIPVTFLLLKIFMEFLFLYDLQQCHQTFLSVLSVLKFLFFEGGLLISESTKSYWKPSLANEGVIFFSQSIRPHVFRPVTVRSAAKPSVGFL